MNEYLKQIGQYQLLSEAEEKELNEKVRNGDKAAREKMINCNLKLVVFLAKQYKTSIPLEDLIQEGNIGLIEAVDRYDAEKGRFATYARHWITKYILQAIGTEKRKNEVSIEDMVDLYDKHSEQEYADVEFEEFIRSFTNKEQLLLQERFINGNTRTAIGNKLNVTAEAVRKQEHKAVDKLKKGLETWT